MIPDTLSPWTLVLRAEWGSTTQRTLLRVFQVQAAWSVMFARPMLVAARNREYQRTTSVFVPWPPKPETT